MNRFDKLLSYKELLKTDYIREGYVYSNTVVDFIHEIMKFKDYEEYNLINYKDNLEKLGIKHLDEYDVSKADEFTIINLLFAMFRIERFYDGFAENLIKNGCVYKWLDRLEEIERK